MSHIISHEDLILDVRNLSKRYFYSNVDSRKYHFKRALNALLGFNFNEHSSERHFWALSNISFKLFKGETLGIIGLNGSGKSTLLKIINGVVLPDKGEVLVTGKVGALIELGAGFKPLLSGRENIYLKSSLLGKTREDLEAILDDIVDFSELGEFIDSPVKTYSSGMKMRLGFSVSIFMKPDLLLMDEVLAVGDFLFQQKCLDRVNQIRDNTSTIFVSHSMNQIQLFCDRVLVLDKGKKCFVGKPKEAIEYYLKEIDIKTKSSKKTHPKKTDAHIGNLFHNEEKINVINHYWADKNLQKTDLINTNDEVNLVMEFILKKELKKELIIGVPIWDNEGRLISGIGSDMDNYKIDYTKNKLCRLILNFPKWQLNSGEYTSVLAIVDGAEFMYRGLNPKIKTINSSRNIGFLTAIHFWRKI